MSPLYRSSVAILFSALLFAAISTAALAADWTVERLRGLVFVHESAEWTPLERGDVVTEVQVIRTLASGRVDLVRDGERIELGGETQVAVQDARGRKFTTVDQHYGKVTVEANVEDIQHFSVQTPYLAAVVKGTRFTVTSRNGRSWVAVDRGRVQVQDRVHRVVTEISRGQSASVSENTVLEVDGGGEAPSIFTFEGEATTPQQLEEIAESRPATTERRGSRSEPAVTRQPRDQTPAAPQSTIGSSKRDSDGSKDRSPVDRDGNGNSGNGNGNNGNGNGNNGNGNSNNGNGNGNSGNGNGNSGNGNSGNGNSGNGNGNNGNNGNGNGNNGNNGNGNGNSGNGNGNSGNGRG